MLIYFNCFWSIIRLFLTCSAILQILYWIASGCVSRKSHMGTNAHYKQTHTHSQTLKLRKAWHSLFRTVESVTTLQISVDSVSDKSLVSSSIGEEHSKYICPVEIILLACNVLMLRHYSREILWGGGFGDFQTVFRHVLLTSS